MAVNHPGLPCNGLLADNPGDFEVVESVYLDDIAEPGQDMVAALDKQGHLLVGEIGSGLQLHAAGVALILRMPHLSQHQLRGGDAQPERAVN